MTRPVPNSRELIASAATLIQGDISRLILPCGPLWGVSILENVAGALASFKPFVSVRRVDRAAPLGRDGHEAVFSDATQHWTSGERRTAFVRRLPLPHVSLQATGN